MADIKIYRVSDGGCVQVGSAHAATLLAETDAEGQPLYTSDLPESEISAGGCASCEPTGFKPKKKEDKVKDNAQRTCS